MITLVAFISVSKTRSESNSKMTIEVGTIVALCVLRGEVKTERDLLFLTAVIMSASSWRSA